jgi:hypothetical protein
MADRRYLVAGCMRAHGADAITGYRSYEMKEARRVATRFLPVNRGL